MKKLLGLVLGFCLGAYGSLVVRDAVADSNVFIGHQEPLVILGASGANGASGPGSAIPLFTSKQTHRSFAYQDTFNVDSEIMIVRPGGPSGASGISSIYLRANTSRVVDTGSDQVVIDAGSTLYWWYPGPTGPSAGGGLLILDQLY